MNFFDRFDEAATRLPSQVAVEVQYRDRIAAWRYADIKTMAERTAAWLATMGIQPGDRCAILADNDAHWCAAYLGVLRLGAVAVPLDTNYKVGQVATLLADCGARVIFTSPKYLATTVEASAAAGTGSRLVLLHGESDEAVSFEAMVGGRTPAPPLPRSPATAADPAVILYTSGTTSDPKGVVLTHGNLLAEREAAFAVVDVNDRDCILGVLPLFHALAQMANLLLPFSVGARVVFLETVNTTELLRALADRNVTLFACVPQFFYLIHQRVTREVAASGAVTRLVFQAMLATSGALRSVGLNAGPLLFRRVHRVLGGRMRLLVTGGSKFDPEVGRDLYRMGFNISQAYGLTECSGGATVARPGDPHVETVGQALPGVDIRIAPPEATGDGEGQDGEVLIRGPIVMAGYFNKPEATAATLKDGWLHTGDLGRLDAEGRLTITGRRKEMIVLSSGKNLYPEEIEAHYRKSAYIKELCVLGLTDPSQHGAERLYAVVVPDAEALRAKKIVNAGDLVRFEMEGASVGLPPHKRVLGYEVWMEPLPRTTTGKLKRFEIERRVKAALAVRQRPGDEVLSDEDRAWTERPDVAPILATVSELTGRPGTPRPEANLELDLGLDSMERVELLTGLEQRVGARVPEDVAHEIFTVRQLAEALIAHRGTGEAREESSGAWGTLLAPGAGETAWMTEQLRPRPVVNAALHALLRLLLFLLRSVIRFEVAGREHVPARGPYLICPNHQSYLDAFILMGLLPGRVTRQAFYVGASEYFETALTRWLTKQINLVPVDPDASLVPAMQAGAAGLRHGRILVLFPEGERSIDGTVRSFKKGAAILSHHLDVPIVPVALDGIHDLWPRNRPIAWSRLRPWRRAPVRVAFGRPLPPGAAGTTYESTTAQLRETVIALWNGLQRDA